MRQQHILLGKSLATIELDRKDHAAAAWVVEECLALPPDRAQGWLVLGKLLGRCEQVARKDDRLTVKEKEEAAKRYAGRAMDALRKTVELSPDDRLLLDSEPDLAGLRERDDFKKLIRK